MMKTACEPAPAPISDHRITLAPPPFVWHSCDGPDVKSPHSRGRSLAHSVAGRPELRLHDPRHGEAVAPARPPRALHPLERRRDRLRFLELSRALPGHVPAA